METRKAHEDRVMAIIRLFEPADRLSAEESMPRGARSIDLLMQLDEASPLWGPLRSWLSRRAVVLEHFSGPPNRAEMAGALTKLAWIHERWRRGELRAPPALLVIADGRPDSALVEYGYRRLGLEGLYQRPGTPIGDLFLVDVRNLSRAPGTSVLRLMGRYRSLETSRENIRHLVRDEGIPATLREVILEAIMRGSVPVGEQEQKLTWKAAVQEGVEIGERRGIERGIELGERRGVERGKRQGIELGKREGIELGKREGIELGKREVLLRIAERAAPGSAEELGQIDDLAELEARVLALIDRQSSF